MACFPLLKTCFDYFCDKWNRFALVVEDFVLVSLNLDCACLSLDVVFPSRRYDVNEPFR